MSDDKITVAEMADWFGNEVPVKAVYVYHDLNRSNAEKRKQLAQIAEDLKHLPADPLARQLVEEHLKQLMKDCRAIIDGTVANYAENLHRMSDTLTTLEKVYGKP